MCGKYGAFGDVIKVYCYAYIMKNFKLNRRTCLGSWQGSSPLESPEGDILVACSFRRYHQRTQGRAM